MAGCWCRTIQSCYLLASSPLGFDLQPASVTIRNVCRRVGVQTMCSQCVSSLRWHAHTYVAASEGDKKKRLANWCSCSSPQTTSRLPKVHGQCAGSVKRTSASSVAVASDGGCAIACISPFGHQSRQRKIRLVKKIELCLHLAFFFLLYTCT